MFPFGKKNKKKQHTQIGFVNSTDNFEQQIGIINSYNSDINDPDSDDSQVILQQGIVNESGAINHGTQIEVITYSINQQ